MTIELAKQLKRQLEIDMGKLIEEYETAVDARVLGVNVIRDEIEKDWILIKTDVKLWD